MKKEVKSEEEKIARARRQLLMVGVICTAVVVFTLWAVSLRKTFAHNRSEYSSTSSFTSQIQEYLQQVK